MGRVVPWVINGRRYSQQGPAYLSLFFLPLEELLVEPVRFRLPLESPELSLRPPGDTRSEELVLLMLQEGQADENGGFHCGQSFTAKCTEGLGHTLRLPYCRVTFKTEGSEILTTEVRRLLRCHLQSTPLHIFVTEAKDTVQSHSL